MFVPFGGAQTCRNMAVVTEQKHLSLSFATEVKIFTLELRHIEINASSSASTVYLAKTNLPANVNPRTPPRPGHSEAFAGISVI